MGVRTYDNAPEPWRGPPGAGLAETVVVASLATVLLLANGRPLGEPQMSGLAGALLRGVLGVVGLILELDPVGRAFVGKVGSALCAGVAAGALFAAVARRRTLAEARVSGLLLALGTSLAAASQSWSAEVPAAAAVAVALLLFSRAEAEDDPTPAARGLLPLALAVALDPSTSALAVVLALTTLVRWRRAVLGLLAWIVPSVLLALGAVALGASPEASSGGGGLALLFSPARGAFVFAPVVLVALAGLVGVLRPARDRRWDQEPEAQWLPRAGAAAALAHIAFVLVAGEGGTGPFWGPRGLAPAWPPLLLLLPEGLAMLRLAGAVIAAVSVAVQALGAFAYDGRWDRLWGGETHTWDATRSPIVFQIRERVVRPAIPAVENRHLVVREHPLVLGGPAGSVVSFSAGRLTVTGADATVGDVLLEGGARVSADRLELRSVDDALFFRVRQEARLRGLELRIDGRGPGTLEVGERTFWTSGRRAEHRVGRAFRLRVPYAYAESGGGDIRIAPVSGDIEITSVALVPTGEPENVLRLHSRGGTFDWPHLSLVRRTSK